MAQIHGIIDSQKFYWRDQSGWVAEPDSATEFTLPDAYRVLRIINANNRFLDPEDKAEAEIVESRHGTES